MKPEEAISYYNIRGAINEIAPFGLGHINDTYKVLIDGRPYLLQKINTQVFQDSESLEQNINFVLAHDGALFPAHFRTEEGKIHLIDDQSCWRLQAYLNQSYSPNEVNSKKQVAAIGSGFGQFANAFALVPPEKFKETIPNFHQLNLRLLQLDQAIRLDAEERVDMVSDLVTKASDFRWINDRFEGLLTQGLAKRLCHNDAKAANILLKNTDDSFAKIIDLDTVGPGYLLFDYGDLMRSIFTPASENEMSLEKLIIRPEYFDVLREAYTQELNFETTELELASLAFGGLYMTYIMAIRFLTDFLQGDKYYKISFGHENMIRARNQLKLLELMEKALKTDYRNEGY